MVIVLSDGTLILESGDPDYQDIIIGNPNPENEIIDPDPTKPVSQLVLETFNIPFIPPVLGGAMPGYDIRNQDATTMMKLSLATELLSVAAGGSEGFAEIELDEDGFARFFVVGADPALSLDIRYCIPTSQVTTPANLVIVRGYDPPPERQLRTSFDGLKNAEIMDYSECAAQSCDEQNVKKFASISYDDPLLDQVYLDDIRNSYELKAFESLIGYIVDMDLPDGADRDAPNFNAGLKITFGDTTKEYIQAPAAILNQFVSEGSGVSSITLQIGGDLIFGSQFGGGGSIPVNTTTIDPVTGECVAGTASIAGAKLTIPRERFERLNKFGNLESDFIGVVDVVFVGRKIIGMSQFGDLLFTLFVRDLKEFITLPKGKNWVWDIAENGDIEVELFSILDNDFAALVCQIYGTKGQVSLISTSPTTRFIRVGGSGVEQLGTGGVFDGALCNIGDNFGYLAIDAKLCIVVERKRPSIDFFDPAGNAGDLARKFISTSGKPGITKTFGITYTPIIIVDKPAPIAYASTAPLSNNDVTRTIAAEGIIDQADGIVDADPTTTQNLEDSELSILQDNTSGATIDVTLPFCTDQECLQIAQNFLAQQNQIIATQSVVLGPTSEPRLGQVMPDGAIINEISYSYSDSSQYLITLTTGPKYLTAGSFNDSKYQLKTEDVTREGVVLQDVGNGTEYVVLIGGFGEITALSMIAEDISVGDKVNVRIYNNPVERI